MAKKSVQEHGGIEAVFNALQGKYKDGLYMGSSISRKEVTSTGSIKLDLALNGGFVKGKIIECYGPESSGKSALAYALLSGIKGPKGFIDAESAYESETAAMYGVDLSTMIVDRPEHIEEGMELVLDMVDAGMEAIVFDSIAGISTKAELEGSMEDHNVGKKASRMGQLMRKLHLKADEKGCTIFFVNQIRDSMSMYGCLHGETLINFVDGKSIPIKDVVNNKIDGYVFCTAPDGSIQKGKIVDWHDNGLLADNESWITIKASNGNNKNGVVAVTVTPNHEVLTTDGFKKAKDIKVGDTAISYTKSKLSGSLLQFMAGCFAGDSPILYRSINTACFTFRESESPVYIEWKRSKVSPFYNVTPHKDGYHYKSGYDVEIANYRHKYGNRSIDGLVDNLSWLSLALWYMDDGTFSAERTRLKISARRSGIDEQTCINLLCKLRELGLNDVKWSDGLVISKYSSFVFFDKIKQFIPECMQYKLPMEFRGFYEDFELESSEAFMPVENTIIDVNTNSKKKSRSKRKFDISIDQYENYSAGGMHSGIIVHNSPITTPGGHALQFHASYRLWVKGVDKIEIGASKEAVGHEMKVHIKKNKFGKPSIDVKVPLIYGKGISPEWEILDIGVEKGIIEKSGSWYSYEGSKIGQGQYNTFTFLLDNPEFVDQIKLKINES